MEIQTYEVTEATTEGRDSFEIEEAAKALIEELGLEGQQELLREPDDSGVSTRIPYQKMTATERAVYSTLYPQRDSPEKYSSGPIPLRVLQVVAHARTLFDHLEIWGPAEYDPDPVLVGINGSTYNPTDVFLLARWGDALAPFDELRERAHAEIERKFTAKAEEVIQECQAFLASPRASVEKELRGENQWKPWTRD